MHWYACLSLLISNQTALYMPVLQFDPSLLHASWCLVRFMHLDATFSTQIGWGEKPRQLLKFLPILILHYCCDGILVRFFNKCFFSSNSELLLFSIMPLSLSTKTHCGSHGRLQWSLRNDINLDLKTQQHLRSKESLTYIMMTFSSSFWLWFCITDVGSHFMAFERAN